MAKKETNVVPAFRVRAGGSTRIYFESAQREVMRGSEARVEGGGRIDAHAGRFHPCSRGGVPLTPTLRSLRWCAASAERAAADMFCCGAM